MINILEIVSELLLNAAVVGKRGENLSRTFTCCRDEFTHERVVKGLCSAEWFREMEQIIKRIPGINNSVALLGIVLSYDAATLTLKSGTTATPLYASLGNVNQDDLIRNTENVAFVGFFPKHSVR